MDYLRRLPIRVQLSIIASMIILIMAFIVFSTYSEASYIIEQKNNEYFIDIISQINRTIASNCDVLNRMTQNISYSMLVQDYLLETDATRQFEKYAQIQDYIVSMVGLKEGIYGIALFNQNRPVFNTYGDAASLWAMRNEIPGDRLFYYTGRKVIQYQGVDINCFIVGAPIYSITDYDDFRERIGTLMIVLDTKALLGTQDNMLRLNGTKFYLYDRDNHLFFSNDETLPLGSIYQAGISADKRQETAVVVENGERYSMQVGDIPDISGKIVLKVPQRELLAGIDEIRRRQSLVGSIAILLLAVPFFFVINNILQPLKKLMRFMNEIKAGKLKNLKKRIELRGYAEIIITAKEFNTMLDEIDDLTHRLLNTNTRLYEAELIKKQSELAYLQSQINPHFLYNTLESIKGVAVDAGAEKVFHMATALGQIFRYCVKGAEVVPLEEELDIIKSYLYIQKMRFENRLIAVYDIAEDILKCKVPKMILQPIVENAIHHGIEPSMGENHLWIRGNLLGNRMVIHIKDDGVGMDEATLESVRNDISEARVSTGHSYNSIGLLNVNNRITLSYGPEYGLQIDSALKEGTEVVLTLPLYE
jgi:two-component system sensor histidine kinase YesM